MTGQLLGGRYALGGLLGSGGSADVFAALDVRLGRDVAVKVVRVPVAPGADPWAQLRAALIRGGTSLSTPLESSRSWFSSWSDPTSPRSSPDSVATSTK